MLYGCYATLSNEYWCCIVWCVCAEGISLLSAFSISFLITYIVKEDVPGDESEGVRLFFLFFGTLLASNLFRNRYILQQFEIGLKVRSTLLAVMYDKVSRLSIKSLT